MPRRSCQAQQTNSPARANVKYCSKQDSALHLWPCIRLVIIAGTVLRISRCYQRFKRCQACCQSSAIKVGDLGFFGLFFSSIIIIVLHCMQHVHLTSSVHHFCLILHPTNYKFACRPIMLPRPSKNPPPFVHVIWSLFPSLSP